VRKTGSLAQRMNSVREDKMREMGRDDSSMSDRIPTIVVSPSIVPGTASTATFNHYAMLRTTRSCCG
jgi:hypothetical protein